MLDIYNALGGIFQAKQTILRIDIDHCDFEHYSDPYSLRII